MANSAFVLSSGVGSDGKSNRATKYQSSHGFSAGSVVRFEQTANGVTGAFVLAQANSGISAEVVGIVESVDAGGNEFTLVYNGEINTSNFITVNGEGVTGSDVWFLDTSVAGGLTSTVPVSSGDIIKPVLTLVSGSQDDKGLVTNYVGTIIGGSNTVSLDSVHPVGEIIAFAGGVSDIPTGWQLCDGSTLDVGGDYASYYSRVGTKYGYNTEMVFTVTSGHTGFVGNTAEQTVSSTAIGSLVLDWAPSAGNTGTILLDADVLTGITGGETSGDDTGYPHGLIYAGGTNIKVGTGGSANSTYSTTSATVKYVKTPDLRARTLLGATSDYVVSWSPRSSGMDGYTAGQIGGSEDADTVVVTTSGSQRVYAAASATSANLRQPFMAAHYIIRTTATAKAALVDGVNVSLADSGLTDHDTSNASNGDILVRGSGANWEELRLFDSYPSNQTNFENSFRIRSDNGYVTIGNNGGDYPLHIKTSTDPQLRLEDTLNSKSIALVAGSSNTHTPNHNLLSSNSFLYVAVEASDVDNPAVADLVWWAGAESGVRREYHYWNNDFAGNVSVTGGIDVAQNIKASGQIYSPLNTINNTTPWAPNCNTGNVQLWTGNAANLQINNASGTQYGGMYTLVLQNTGGNDVTLNFAGSYYVFANGIRPNIIRPNSVVVISMVTATGKLLCTWAEDFS
jgi:hypothetical protein|tara:strand:+ start:5222 stop:7264 length:2043 start_codon:yes stop_codon:yes gene_type:complete